MIMIIYLLHFDRHVRRAQHYIGSTIETQFTRRMRAHARGYGSSLTKAAFQQHVSFNVARLWSAPNRDLERTLKERGHARTLCPICETELPLQLPAQPHLALPHQPGLTSYHCVGWPTPKRTK